jgi:IclR family pca regulon transcriptional regulator
MLLGCMSRADFAAWLKGRALPRLTAHTVLDIKTLQALVSAARTQDWCVASQEHELGVFALAVPLRNMQGKVVAALNVVTTPERLLPGVMQHDLLPLLQDAARELRPLL